VATTAKSGQAAGFNITQLRRDIASGKRKLRITSHAQVEAFKDGLLLADLRHIFEHGEVVEHYPVEQRGLLYAELPVGRVPVHIVVEDTPTEGVVVTAYIPDRRQWIADRQRRKSKGMK
jgi:hypothetical protein